MFSYIVVKYFCSIRYDGNKLVTKKTAFVFMHVEKEKRKYKKINLVTVQYQKVKLIIQWKKQEFYK